MGWRIALAGGWLCSLTACAAAALQPSIVELGALPAEGYLILPAGHLGWMGPDYMIVDGLRYPRWYEDTPLCFDGNGKPVFAAVERDGKWRAVLDGVEGPPHDRVWGACFAPAGSRWAYAALDGAEWRVVVDGVPGPPQMGELVDYYSDPEAELAAVCFSPDGRRTAYALHDGDRESIVVDGVAGPAYEWVTEGPEFSLDSRRVAYVAREGWDTFVVLDGEEGPHYRELFTYGMVDATDGPIPYHGDYTLFEPDGSLPYVAYRDGKAYRVVHPALP